MKKFIITGMAVAMLVVPSIASADVPRYQSQDATFTITQPAGAVNQWENVWTHDFKVAVNPCDNTFTGTGVEYGHDQNGPYTNTEKVTGTFGNGSATLTATRADGLVFTLDNAPTDGKAITIATFDRELPWVIEMKVTKPAITNSSNYKNHGEYVKAMGGGADAAHSCIGMPISSK